MKKNNDKECVGEEEAYSLGFIQKEKESCGYVMLREVRRKRNHEEDRTGERGQMGKTKDKMKGMLKKAYERTEPEEMKSRWKED